MTDQNIYPLASRQGHGIIINGNFVSVRYWVDDDVGHYDAEVSAFCRDSNIQTQTFDTLAEAVAWGVTAAQTHEGQAYPLDTVAYWEIRHGYSITVTPTRDGAFEGETFAMWHDIDPSPIRDYEKFPTQDEALQYARNAADQYQPQYHDNLRIVHEIGDALAAHIPNPETPSTETPNPEIANPEIANPETDA